MLKISAERVEWSGSTPLTLHSTPLKIHSIAQQNWNPGRNYHGVRFVQSYTLPKDAEEIFQTVNNAIKLGQWQSKIERDIESIEAGMY